MCVAQLPNEGRNPHRIWQGQMLGGHLQVPISICVSHVHVFNLMRIIHTTDSSHPQLEWFNVTSPLFIVFNPSSTYLIYISYEVDDCFPYRESFVHTLVCLALIRRCICFSIVGSHLHAP